MDDQLETGNESVDTADVTSASDSVETADANADLNGDDTGVGNTTGKTDDGETGSRRDGRLNEVINQMNDLKSQLHERDNQIYQLISQQRTPVQNDQPKADSLDNYSDDQIRDMMEDEPGKYNRLVIAKAEENATNRIVGLLNKTQQTNAWNKFTQENDDYQAKVKDGSIQRLMQSDPTHSARSAYMELTMQDKINAEVAKAVKAKEEEINRNNQAKRKIRPLGRGSGDVTLTDKIDESALKNTSKFGGRNKVLAARAMQRMAESG